MGSDLSIVLQTSVNAPDSIVQNHQRIIASLRRSKSRRSSSAGAMGKRGESYTFEDDPMNYVELRVMATADAKAFVNGSDGGNGAEGRNARARSLERAGAGGNRVLLLEPSCDTNSMSGVSSDVAGMEARARGYAELRQALKDPIIAGRVGIAIDASVNLGDRIPAQAGRFTQCASLLLANVLLAVEGGAAEKKQHYTLPPVTLYVLDMRNSGLTDESAPWVVGDFMERVKRVNRYHLGLRQQQLQKHRQQSLFPGAAVLGIRTGTPRNEEEEEPETGDAGAGQARREVQIQLPVFTKDTRGDLFCCSLQHVLLANNNTEIGGVLKVVNTLLESVAPKGYAPKGEDWMLLPYLCLVDMQKQDVLPSQIRQYLLEYVPPTKQVVILISGTPEAEWKSTKEREEQEQRSGVVKPRATSRSNTPRRRSTSLPRVKPDKPEDFKEVYLLQDRAPALENAVKLPDDESSRANTAPTTAMNIDDDNDEGSSSSIDFHVEDADGAATPPPTAPTPSNAARPSSHSRAAPTASSAPMRHSDSRDAAEQQRLRDEAEAYAKEQRDRRQSLAEQQQRAAEEEEQARRIRQQQLQREQEEEQQWRQQQQQQRARQEEEEARRLRQQQQQQQQQEHEKQRLKDEKAAAALQEQIRMEENRLREERGRLDNLRKEREATAMAADEEASHLQRLRAERDAKLKDLQAQRQDLQRQQREMYEEQARGDLEAQLARREKRQQLPQDQQIVILRDAPPRGTSANKRDLEQRLQQLFDEEQAIYREYAEADGDDEPPHVEEEREQAYESRQRGSQRAQDARSRSKRDAELASASRSWLRGDRSSPVFSSRRQSSGAASTPRRSSQNSTPRHQPEPKQQQQQQQQPATRSEEEEEGEYEADQEVPVNSAQPSPSAARHSVLSETEPPQVSRQPEPERRDSATQYEPQSYHSDDEDEDEEGQQQAQEPQQEEQQQQEPQKPAVPASTRATGLPRVAKQTPPAQQQQQQQQQYPRSPQEPRSPPPSEASPAAPDVHPFPSPPAAAAPSGGGEEEDEEVVADVAAPQHQQQPQHQHHPQHPQHQSTPAESSPQEGEERTPREHNPTFRADEADMDEDEEEINAILSSVSSLDRSPAADEHLAASETSPAEPQTAPRAAAPADVPPSVVAVEHPLGTQQQQQQQPVSVTSVSSSRSSFISPMKAEEDDTEEAAPQPPHADEAEQEVEQEQEQQPRTGVAAYPKPQKREPSPPHAPPQPQHHEDPAAANNAGAAATPFHDPAMHSLQLTGPRYGFTGASATAERLSPPPALLEYQRDRQLQRQEPKRRGARSPSNGGSRTPRGTANSGPRGTSAAATTPRTAASTSPPPPPVQDTTDAFLNDPELALERERRASRYRDRRYDHVSPRVDNKWEGGRNGPTPPEDYDPIESPRQRGRSSAQRPADHETLQVRAQSPHPGASPSTRRGSSAGRRLAPPVQKAASPSAPLRRSSNGTGASTPTRGRTPSRVGPPAETAASLARRAASQRRRRQLEEEERRHPVPHQPRVNRSSSTAGAVSPASNSHHNNRGTTTTVSSASREESPAPKPIMANGRDMLSSQQQAANGHKAPEDSLSLLSSSASSKPLHPANNGNVNTSIGRDAAQLVETPHESRGLRPTSSADYSSNGRASIEAPPGWTIPMVNAKLRTQRPSR